ncbi:MAG: hypothetical protein ACRBN8_46650 [Nannocystales bacterium]
MCRTNLDPLVLLASTSLLALFGCTSDDTAAAETDDPTSATGNPDPEPTGSTGGTSEGPSGSSGGSTGADPTDTETTGNPEITVAAGPTKGGPIAANEAGDRLAVANKATGDVTIFEIDGAAEPVELARVPVGDEPTSVVWNAAGTEVFVVNRGSGSVSRIVDADGEAPAVDGVLDVGSEPSIGTLSPTGQRLYVSNWADGSVSVIDTAAMEVLDTLALGGAPYAICVSNDLDDDDDDETLYVTDFYALDRTGEEATDTGRRARVFAVSAGDGSVEEIALDAFADAGIPAAKGSGAFPNQLYGCVLNDAHLYVTSVGASPEPLGTTTDFRQNVQGLVHAIEVDSGAVDEARTVNLNALVDEQLAPKRFVAIPADIAFAPNSDFGYVASLASDSVLRVDWSVSPPVAGSPSGASFLPASLSPTGIAITGTTAYVYNEVARSVTVTDLAAQETVADVESAPQPAAADESDILAGQRFFNTGLARWSANGWVSCASCHPFGTTDNVTWTFPAGPRQSVDLTATFDASGSVQRILNWSAIFDEVHDFELNTRGVANGTGAIVSDAGLNADGTPNTAARIDFVGPGGVANPTNGFNRGSAAAAAAGGATPDDWDHIEDYIRSLRSPHARTVTAGDPEAGRQVFLDGGCQNCHGGALWTLSERYYNPLLDSDASTVTLAEAGVANVGDVRADQLASTDTSTFSVIDVDANGPPHRHSCVVRRVGTFDAAGPDGHGAAEIRQNGGNAQGLDGFNVPSLLGIGMGAPFLHNGAAASLEELLSDEFGSHLRSGNQVFSPTDEQRADLVAFLQTIDDDTETVAVPSGQQFCPTGFSPPVIQPE